MLRRVAPIFVLAVLACCQPLHGQQSASGVWSSKFPPPPGANGEVHAMTVYGTNLIVAGRFTEIAGVHARGLAQFDGKVWSEFGGGAQLGSSHRAVFTLLADGTNLYVGGSFAGFGGLHSPAIVRWNGSHWEPLGSGLAHVVTNAAVVYALHKQGTNLYVGGSFTRAGGLNAFNIARWDGANWHAMDDGAYLHTDFEDPQANVHGRVNAIAGDGANIYVGGFFFRAGSSSATNLAKWNGASWEAIGNTSEGAQRYTWEGEPVSGFVHGLAWQDGALYVGGDFTKINGIAITNIARLRNSTWDSPITVAGPVNILFKKESATYISGNFDTATTNSVSFPATNLVKLQDGNWSPVHAPLADQSGIYTAQSFGDGFFVGGSFGYIDRASASNIARLDGSGWFGIGRRLGNSLTGFGQSIASDGTNIYVTGLLASAGTTDAQNSIAHWNGTNWTVLPQIAPGFAAGEIALVGSKLYVGGIFKFPELGITNIAVWDGQRWTGAGDPGADFIFDNRLVVAQSNVFGSFTNGTQRWDGQRWHTLPWPVPLHWNEKLGTDGTNVFMARGNVTGTLVYVARWDGSQLLEYPPPNLYSVSAVGGFGTNILVAGYRIPMRHFVLQWNGAGWAEHAVEPSSSALTSITTVGDKIIVTGSFTNIGGVAANSIAQWDGSTWRSFDTGIQSRSEPGIVWDSTAAMGRVYVTGEFDKAGPNSSGNIAVWHQSSDVHLALEPAALNQIRVTGGVGDRVQIEASDTLTDWTRLTDFIMPVPTVTATDPRDLSPTNRFYRVRILEP